MTVGLVVPTLIADAGKQVAQRFLAFFAATIRHTNTRMAYYCAVLQCFAWCDRHQLGQLADIEPLHVTAYHEKGGKHHEMPAYHTLEAYLDAYLDAAGIRDSGKSPSSARPCGTAVPSPRTPCTASTPGA